MVLAALVRGLDNGKWAPFFFLSAAMSKNLIMSQSQTIPFRFRESNLNVIQIEDEPWFIANEVCSILGISNSWDAIGRLDDDEKQTSVVPREGQTRRMNLVNESGLYQLIFQSRKTEAKQFKRWVTHEVLPSIRKHGGYLTAQKTEELLANPDLIIELATNLKNERVRVSSLLVEIDTRNDIIEEQEVQLRIQSPAVEYYRNVLAATDTVPTNVIAKELGMSAISLHRILNKEHRVIYKQAGIWLPYAKYQNLGYTKTKTYTYTGSDGLLKTDIRMVWTQAGRHFIHELLKAGKS